MKGRFFLAFVLTALVGSALHFGYDLVRHRLWGLSARCRRAGAFEAASTGRFGFGLPPELKAQDAQAAERTLAALLFMPAFLLGIYYTLESGFAFTVAGWLKYCALRALCLRWGSGSWRGLRKTGGLSWLCGVLVIAALYGAALIFIY